jgi:hypothetical protein
MSFAERCRLEELVENRCRPARVAVLLGRHRDTIRRELARGQTSSGYRARVGQEVIDTNLKRPKERKLQQRPALLAEVLRGLKLRHSPEQIAGRLREEFPEDPEMWVSHETIYQAMYVQPRGELARLVKAALRTGRAQRKPQGRNDIADRSRFKAGMVNISERPAEADDRAIPGHWEGDLILGANNASAMPPVIAEGAPSSAPPSIPKLPIIPVTVPNKPNNGDSVISVSSTPKPREKRRNSTLAAANIASGNALGYLSASTRARATKRSKKRGLKSSLPAGGGSVAAGTSAKRVQSRHSGGRCSK